MKNLKILAPYPRNFILRNPLIGASILMLFDFVFILLYKPLDPQESPPFSFEVTMALYSFAAGLSAWLSIRLLQSIKYFSDDSNWSLLKEIFAAYIVLQCMGIGLYLAGFLFEPTPLEARWNLMTFIDSCKYSFLIGILPFGFFTSINIRYLLNPTSLSFPASAENKSLEPEPVIDISSSLVKETLSFPADHLLFVASDGNYVVLYLCAEEKLKKHPVRNSIANIEEQLAHIPYYVRCHRAFIVNLKKVQAKRGNALGYKLRIANSSHIVPVSRANVKAFDERFVQLPR